MVYTGLLFFFLGRGIWTRRDLGGTSYGTRIFRADSRETQMSPGSETKL